MAPGLVKTLGTALALQWRAAPVPAALSLVLSSVYGLGAAAGGFTLKALLDELARGGSASHSRVALLAVATASVGALGSALLHVTGYLVPLVHWRVTAFVERALFEKVSGLGGLAELETPALQGQLRLAEQAAQEAPQQLSELALAVARTAVAVGSSLTVVAWVSPQMVVALLAACAVGLLAQVRRSRKDASAAQALAQTYRWREYHRALLLDPRAAKELRLFGLRELFLGRLLSALARLSGRELSIARGNALTQVALALLSAVVTAGGAWVVARAALAGRLAVGDVALFLAAVAGVQAASASLVLELGGAARSLLLFRGYLAVLALQPRVRSGEAEVPPLRGAVELKDVWFRYSPSGPWVLRGVSLTLRAGETVGLVGLNGAGKSTLVKLLCRFYDPERGALLWDGVDFRALSLAGLRARLATTFQDFMSYDATAADNVGFGDVRFLEDGGRIRLAAARAEVDARLLRLPDGYRTLLSRSHAAEGEEELAPGVTLSGGEWQRLALARSLFRTDAELLVLDEPSSGLDPDAEHRVHRALCRHGVGKARLLVSHRLSALRGADRICVLSEGRISEEGSHEALMARGELYAKLFSLQASGYRDEPVALEELG